MEFLGVNVQSGDDFSVDELLTFADDDVLVAGDEEESHEGKHEGEDRVLCSVSGGTANLLHQESPVEIAFLVTVNSILFFPFVTAFSFACLILLAIFSILLIFMFQFRSSFTGKKHKPCSYVVIIAQH